MAIQFDDPAQTTVGKSPILLVAGFGDNASMFDGLLATDLVATYQLLPLNLPGFGAPALEGDTTLEVLATHVAEKAKETGARIIVAHSVASIVASLAATRSDCPIKTILSLEGNITAEDAYFSGTAADHPDPQSFRTAFLARLDDMAAGNPIIARYRRTVETADPLALWQLGCDARRFSDRHMPGDVLRQAARAVYFHNPDNCPQSTLSWLEENRMERVLMEGASHWPSLDQPEHLASRMAEVLSDVI